MSHPWFQITSLLPTSAATAPARRTGARPATSPPATCLTPGWSIFPWLRAILLPVLSTLGRAWRRVLATLRWSRLSVGGRGQRRGIPIEVLVSNDAERRTLERQLRVTLHKLRGALGPLPSGRRVAVVVQHTLDAEVPLASRCDVRRDGGGTVLFLIRLALHVHGRALPTDEVLAQLADRYVALAFGDDPPGPPHSGAPPVGEAGTPTLGSVAVDTGLADPVPAVPAAVGAAPPLSAIGSVADEVALAAEGAGPRDSGRVPATTPDAAPQARPVPARRASRPPARSSATRSPAVAIPLIDPLGLRTSPPAPRPIGTPVEGASAPVPPGADAAPGTAVPPGTDVAPGATLADPAATERPGRRDRNRRRGITG